MSDKSGIEWTDATWNPTVGCTKVSPGCDHCYAETLVNRFAGTSAAFPARFDTVTVRSERFLTQPLRWKRPRRIFVNSLSDLFHRDIPDEFIADVFAVMAATPQHTYQLLTKRHGRIRSLLRSGEFYALVEDAAVERLGLPGVQWPLPNLWVGVSAEDQHWADVRIPTLLDTPAAVRFLSCEPLLGPIDLPSGPLDWVIVGGESGPNARPMHRTWVRNLREQCVRAGVPFLFKQWGAWAPTSRSGIGVLPNPQEQYGEIVADKRYPSFRRVYRNVGKKSSGRLLDGRTWDQYPTNGKSVLV